MVCVDAMDVSLLPGLVQPAAFVAAADDAGGYRTRAILALAAVTPTPDFPAAAARSHALRLAGAYGVDRVEVAMAHAGGLLASGSDAAADLAAAAPELAGSIT